MLRRTLLRNAFGGAVALLLGQTLTAQETAAAKSGASTQSVQSAHSAGREPRRIKIHASRFVYSPNHIVLKQHETVVIELTSSDFTHGFLLPDFDTRTDILPGQVTLLTITPHKVGDFIFLCDNFCGEGHEKMQGKFTVTAVG